MKRGTITIDGKGNVHISSTPVWMSACEIADLLGVFSGKVNGRIRSEQGFVDLYSIEMVTILSFCIATPQAKTLRRWIIDRLTEKNSSPSPMIVCYTLGKRYN